MTEAAMTHEDVLRELANNFGSGNETFNGFPGGTCSRAQMAFDACLAGAEALAALENIAMAARRALAFGHQATPQTAERMIERKEIALRQILAICEHHGVTSSVLRESPAPSEEP